MTTLRPFRTAVAGVLLTVLWVFCRAAEAPTLSVQALPSRQVAISWPLAAGDYTLEETAALGSAAAWRAVGQPVVPQDDRLVVVVDAVESAQYFRLTSTAPQALTIIEMISPPSGANGVSVNRDTIFEFSAPLAADTQLTANNLYAEFGGRRLLSRIELVDNRRRATLFYLENLPSGARIQVTFDATNVRDASGQLVDADGDGQPGGRRQIFFDTFSATPVVTAAVIGKVFASDPDAGPTPGSFINRPLKGVTITVDGAEETLRTTTAADGSFKLQPAPVGRFFVHVDGRTAEGSQWPSGDYYPFVGKAWEAVAGRDDTLASGTGEIFLPLVKQGTLQPVSATQPTTVKMPADVVQENPALKEVELRVPANGLYADDGTRGGRVGMAPRAGGPASRAPAARAQTPAGHHDPDGRSHEFHRAGACPLP
jgi:hypothetical protein